MSKSNSDNKPNTLPMAPENGNAEIHYPQHGDNTEQDKAVESAALTPFWGENQNCNLWLWILYCFCLLGAIRRSGYGL